MRISEEKPDWEGSGKVRRRREESRGVLYPTGRDPDCLVVWCAVQYLAEEDLLERRG